MNSVGISSALCVYISPPSACGLQVSGATGHLLMDRLPGLVGYYTWNGIQWNDLSTQGNHVTEFKGEINVGVLENNHVMYLYGTTYSGVKFPSTILPPAITVIISM